MPDPTTTGTGEEAQFPVARLLPQELQHLPWIGAGQPLPFSHERSLLPEQQIERPATTNMDTRLAAVVQYVLGTATGVLQGMGKDGHSVELAFLVNRAGKLLHGWGEPGGVAGDGAEGV